MSKRPYKEYKKVSKEKADTSKSSSLDVEEYVKRFATSLKRDVAQAQLLARLSASTGQYQPILAEQLTQELNFNPSAASSADITNWLLHPQVYDQNLRALSQFLEYAVGQYHKAVHYYPDMLSFNCRLLPKDVNTSFYIENDWARYKNSYLKACDLIARLKPQDRFHAMTLATIQDGVSFWWIEDTNTEISFLQLPTDYCYITSKWAMGWTAAIDLSYFDRMSYTPNIIPELQNAYKVFITKREEGLAGKDLAPYQYYAMSPDKCWVLTFDPNRAIKVPPLTPTFGAALDLISYRQLLKDKSALELWKVIAAKIPMKKNTDEMALPYEEAANLVDMIQSTLPDNISIFATPFDTEPIVTNQVGTLDDIVNLSNNTFYSAMGTTGNFFGENDNDSAKAIVLNAEIDYNYVARIMYAQFDNMVNWMLNLKVRPYHWCVRFFGNNLTRREDISAALKLVTTANFPVSYLSSVCGYLPHEVESLSLLENAMGTKEALKPLISQFQTNGNTEGDVGRERLGDADLSAEGEATRESRELWSE